MQKINLSLKNVTAILVTKALRAVKGDYILVEGDGSTSVVPSAVFKAMTVLSNHRSNSIPREPLRVLEPPKRSHVWPQVEAALKDKGALTTSQLAGIVDVPFKNTPTEARNFIGSVCRSMEEKNVLESVKVDAPNVRGDVGPVSLWALKDRTTQHLTNGGLHD
jgi:hypothetical protein|tara:strand:- start:6225 stop:6713 length:489 start_codon:yes stop_codon:yes gene_type:complete